MRIVLSILCLMLSIALFAQGNAASEAMKKLYSAEVYPTKVVNVFAFNNATAFRNKIVETVDSLIYFIDYKGNSMRLGSSALFYLPNVVTIDGEQSITGKKVFTDTLSASKGMRSGGLIDTKGLNTEGSATKAAISLKGVQSEKDTLVTSSFTLDGRYGTVNVDCSTGLKNLTFPPETNTEGWFFILGKEDDSGNDLVLKNSNGVEFYRLKSKMVVIVKNKNLIWKRER